MFASFTSMLPSGITFNGNKDERERERLDKEKERDAPENTPRTDDSEGKLKEGTVDEQGSKRKRERNPNETFIVVRPPPSVSNHPLNLQLQLVPPQAKERSASGSSSVSGVSNVSTRRSVDLSAEDGGDSLARVPSGRSGRSDPSSFYANSSSASMSSISSSASTASSVGRRMIVPLYNLSAHNVMTNTVLDAGTDAKVAKFHKRGMEILALAVLECVEIWPSYGRSGDAGQFLNAVNMNGGTLSPGGTLDGDALLMTPTSSAISLSSAGSHPTHSQMQPAPSTPKTPTSASYASRGSVTPTPAQSGAKRIFGKIFKKRDPQSPSAGGGGSHSRSGSMESRGMSPTVSELGRGYGIASGKRNSFNPSVGASTPTPTTPVPTSTSAGAPGQQVLLQPAVLGIQPTLSSPRYPPAGRPTRYVWIVRKWLKGGDSGLLGGVIHRVNMVGANIGMPGVGDRPGSSTGAGNMNGMEVGVEVRFEWIRGQSKSQDKGSRRKSLGQAALGKRASMSEEPGAGRSRRSLAAETSEKQKENSRSRVRHAKGATGQGSANGTPRVSGESRRSIEVVAAEGPSPHDSRTNSMTSASLSEEAAHMLRNVGTVEEVDEGEESDPEDSETPWTCTLIVSSVPCNPTKLWEHERSDPLKKHDSQSRRSHISTTPPDEPSAAASGLPPALTDPSETVAPSNVANAAPPHPPLLTAKSRPDVPGTLLKLKVGALSPAPHHPKVVAQLKVPFPLPDIEVEHARVRKRVVTPAGVARPVSRAGEDERPGTRGRGNGGGMFGGDRNGNGGTGGEGTVLTAEEIKDVLSCTAFWIVVREGFGGVGKVNRKGDGWRIRG